MATLSNIPAVSCIILNYNGGKLLSDTLDSLRGMRYASWKAVVVDNGSTDGSPDVVRSRYPWAELVENGENLGFGAGNNIGIRHALAQGAEWVFLLNNDITVDPHLLARLMDVAVSDKKIGILGPKIYHHANPDLLWYAGGRINYVTGIISHRGLRERDSGQYEQVEDTDYVTGCALLTKRTVLETVGMFDPVYHPFYTEDADFCVRTHHAGYRVVYVPQAKLWHKISASSGGGMTPFKTRLKVEHNLIFFRRYARWYHWLTIPWCIGAATLVFVVRELFRGNFAVVAALGQGFGKGFRRLFSAERSGGQ